MYLYDIHRKYFQKYIYWKNSKCEKYIRYITDISVYFQYTKVFFILFRDVQIKFFDPLYTKTEFSTQHYATNYRKNKRSTLRDQENNLLDDINVSEK